MTYSDSLPRVTAEMLRTFDRITFERVGLLQGEFALMAGAEAVLRPDGTCIKINVACEDRWADDCRNTQLTSPEFNHIREHILRNWNDLPLYNEIGVISDANHANYFHSTLEMIPRARLLAPFCDTIFVPDQYRSSPHIRHLVERLSRHTRIISPPHPILVRNPMFAHDQISASGLHWLRQVAGLRARPGTRLLYIRRGQSARGGGIRETPEFLELLQNFGFETVDFGQGELDLPTQIQRLDGARLILAAHGAALTNLAYLDPPLGVIEITGLATARTMYAELCGILGFDYAGIFVPACPTTNELLPDLGEVLVAIGAAMAKKEVLF